jgi:hypothetical protein
MGRQSSEARQLHLLRVQQGMLMQAIKHYPKRKRCPHCSKVKDVKKGFGFRTVHSKAGYPERTLPQSHCRQCRSQGTRHSAVKGST